MGEKIYEHNLVDDMVFRYSINESASKAGRVVAEGIFSKADEPNQNNRVYPRALWERIINDTKLKKKMANRGLYGHMEHPTSGRTDLKEASHVVTKLWMKANDPNVYGRLETLKTRAGQDLAALLQDNCELGVSSRGSGSVETKQDGYGHVCTEDFQYKTHDAVSEPSVIQAMPKMKKEDVETTETVEVEDGYLKVVETEDGIQATVVEDTTEEGKEEKEMQDKEKVKTDTEKTDKKPEKEVEEEKSVNTSGGSTMKDGLQKLKETRDLVKAIDTNAMSTDKLDDFLAESQVTVDSLVNENPGLATFGSEVQDLIKEKRANSIKEMDDKHKAKHKDDDEEDMDKKDTKNENLSDKYAVSLEVINRMSEDVESLEEANNQYSQQLADAVEVIEELRDIVWEDTSKVDKAAGIIETFKDMVNKSKGINEALVAKYKELETKYESVVQLAEKAYQSAVNEYVSVLKDKTTLSNMSESVETYLRESNTVKEVNQKLEALRTIKEDKKDNKRQMVEDLASKAKEGNLNTETNSAPTRKKKTLGESIAANIGGK